MTLNVKRRSVSGIAKLCASLALLYRYFMTLFSGVLLWLDVSSISVLFAVFFEVYALTSTEGLFVGATLIVAQYMVVVMVISFVVGSLSVVVPLGRAVVLHIASTELNGYNNKLQYGIYAKVNNLHSKNVVFLKITVVVP